jgi:hypothetical protein
VIFRSFILSLLGDPGETLTPTPLSTFHPLTKQYSVYKIGVRRGSTKSEKSEKRQKRARETGRYAHERKNKIMLMHIV